MTILYEVTVGALAPQDIDFSLNDTTPPSVPQPSGSGWRLVSTSVVNRSLYYIWVKGAPIITVTTNYLMLESDEVILVDATAGPVTITLFPTPVIGTIITVKKIDSSANIVTNDGNGKNIDGQATQTISNQFTADKMTYDGTAWFII